MSIKGTIMRLSFTAAFLFFYFITFSQLAQTAQVMNYMTLEGRFNKNFMDAEGSPLLWDEWLPGHIVFKNNQKLENISLRYNAFDNFLEVQYQGNEYVVLAVDYKEFSYTDNRTKQQMTYKNITLANKEVLPIEVLLESATVYGLHNYINISRGSASGSGGLNPTKDKFQRNSMFCVIKDGELTKVNRNKKAILKALHDQDKVLENFMEDNNLDVKKDGDLAKLLTHYGTVTK